jgi:hypothetical protein
MAAAMPIPRPKAKIAFLKLITCYSFQKIVSKRSENLFSGFTMLPARHYVMRVYASNPEEYASCIPSLSRAPLLLPQQDN